MLTLRMRWERCQVTEGGTCCRKMDTDGAYSLVTEGWENHILMESTFIYLRMDPNQFVMAENISQVFIYFMCLICTENIPIY